jgi:hypothetical protein
MEAPYYDVFVSPASTNTRISGADHSLDDQGRLEFSRQTPMTTFDR